MKTRSKHIPVNKLPTGIGEGIVIVRIEHHGKPNIMEVERSHRDSGYTFILQEKGVTHIEIDFQIHVIQAPALVFIHPNQIHRLIEFGHAVISSWIITAENLQPEFLGLLDDLSPANTLSIHMEAHALLMEAAAISVKLYDRREEKLYGFILKESFNTLVALVLSQYLAQNKPIEKYSRFEVIAKAFKSALESSFATEKSPTAYADALNVSTSYLNECVKNATGSSVSHHIQQRIVLEAKRLLFHSNESIKEIAAALGYDDYAYFTRLFVKVTGVTPSVFRSKNRDLS